MRLAILGHGHSLGIRLLFRFIALASRQPVAGILKLMKYRADLFGKPMSALAQRAMRGRSLWSVADRELMAAVISQANACRYGVAAHSAVAARAYHDEARVAAIRANPEGAPIAQPLRATLLMLRC
jgi:AhpD family alkylhydroperoxidase